MYGAQWRSNESNVWEREQGCSMVNEKENVF